MKKRLLQEYPPRGGRLSVSDAQYQTRRAQSEGEQDLVRLARTTPDEGVWFFADGVWYSIRAGGWLEGGVVALTAPLPAHEYGTQATHYHTHPFFVEQCSQASYFERLVAMVEPGTMPGIALPVFAGHLAAYHSAVPSAQDLDTYRALLARAECPLEFRIAGAHGLTRVELDDRKNRNRLYRAARAGVEKELLAYPETNDRPRYKGPSVAAYVDGLVDHHAQAVLSRALETLSERCDGLTIAFLDRRN